MFDEEFLIGAKFDKNTTVADFIKQYKGSQADCFDLIINDAVIPGHVEMRDAIKMRIQERQVMFKVRYNNEPMMLVKFGLSKTIKSLKDYLHDVKKIPVDQHQMAFNKQDWNDDATLKDCNIIDGSFLCVSEKEMTVYDLIKVWKNSKADDYDLVFDEKVVPRTMTLREAGISETSKFELRIRRTKISFTVKSITGIYYQVDFYPSDTILNLKQYIEHIEDIPIDQQRLIFEGRQLEDKCILHKCGIKNNSEIALVLRLRG